MPTAPLQPVSIVAPGFAGLNTQEASVSVAKEFALRAENAVIDQYGRIGSRKGWDNINGTAFTGEPGCIHEHVTSTGSTTVYYVVGGVVYSLNTTTGVSTTEYTIASAPADDYWQALSFNNDVYLFHDGSAPIINHVSHSGWELVSAHSALPTSVTQVGCATSAYGRMWIARTNLNKTTVYWSDLLIGYDFTGGTASSLNIEKSLTNGTDEITALAAFNGFFIVFCKKSILVYQGADNDPTSNIQLVEVIDGVGCIARDSVQDIGTDLLFLSDTGIRSLSRIIQEKSAPVFDVSKNVRDQLIADVIINNSSSSIRSVYHEKEAFYLLSLVDRQITYVFDTRTKLQDGSLRVTTWSLFPKAFCSMRNRDLLLARNGYVGKYTGYSDNGVSFRFAYYTSHLDGGNASILKILKKATLLMIGGSDTTVIMNWATDYSTAYSSGITLLPDQTTSEFNIAEFNISSFGAGINISNIRQQFSGTGRVFQVGIEADILTDSLSIQQLDIYVKTGRTL
jgi:hypothetical protein